MTGNVETMTLSVGNVIPLRNRIEVIENEPLEDLQDLFLSYLIPAKKHLYNFIRKAMNFSLDSDDIYQETLLKGFRYFHSFNRNKNFKTWIFTIAHNLLKDAFKEKNLKQPHFSLSDVEEINELESEKVNLDEIWDIYSAAAQLKPRQREVFFLYYYNEFEIFEIGEITGLTRTNIKFILHQSRNVIRKVMEVKA